MNTATQAKQGTSIALSEKTLARCPSGIARPEYDRRALSPGILHMSVGGFHRAHQAVYLDDLFAKPDECTWGIVGAGLLEQDSLMREALVPQDCLYTLLERSAAGEHARIIGSIIGFHHAPQKPRHVIELIAAPFIRIVTLTITEGGYCLDQESGELDLRHPSIVHDLADPHAPRSGIGYLVAGLAHRRRSGHGSLTIQSCDNLQSNGEAARRAVVGLALGFDKDLAAWIEDNVAFPNSMVDRITPSTSDDDRRLMKERYGLADAWPVVSEPFRQWIIEDEFSNGRPQWENVGVQMTRSVAPYEKMKIRLLNASHSAMGYLGYLTGFRSIDEIVRDQGFGHYIRSLMDEEVTPLLDPVPGVNLTEYKATLIERFSNPAIKDQASRICMDGSSKLPKFVLPSIREQLQRGGPITRLCLVIAAWCRFLSGRDEQGASIPIDDPLAAILSNRAAEGGMDAAPILGLTEVFGSLGEVPRFREGVNLLLRELYTHGARSVLQRCNEGKYEL